MESQKEGKHKDHPAPDFYNQEPEAELNIMAAFATTYQRYLTTIITMVKSQTPLIIQPIALGMCHTLPHLDLNRQKQPIKQLRPVVNEASILASVTVQQPIIQAVISSVEMFDGTKSKFESWIASVENAAQISEQDILCIAFSKMESHYYHPYVKGLLTTLDMERPEK